EVEGIRAWAGGDAIVAQEAADLPADLAADLPADLAADLPADLAAESEAGQGGADKVGVVVQTTQSAAALAAIIDALHERDISPIVRDTICFATRQRQEAAMDLAARVDIMLVVGGRNSGNTTRLAQLCQAVCPRTYHIEGASELMPSWFEGVETVGITAGASTPESQIIAVEQALQDAENESRERGEGGLSMEAASL
ncbi:MAG: hypothetical protein LBH64_05050, partial [Coriobacteriales bacterium]|nr:hypothetical protein [Coriobacteriales bacterium]